MHLKILLLLILANTAATCQTNKKTSKQKFETTTDSIVFFDQSRNRKIPVLFYFPKSKAKIQGMKPVIISHGYSYNNPGAYAEYASIAKNLAANGYFVASIEHDLPTDDLVPLEGKPQIVRRPAWEKGSKNIFFVIGELKKQYPELDFKKLTLIGHSNGGDMSALFAHQHPEMAAKVITLDNRRMELPRTANPKIYSLRSSDQPADEGVLPTAEEQKKFGITIVKLQNTIHNDMGDRGTSEQKNEINRYIIDFLNH